MKKIITGMIIAILLLNAGIYVFADETKSTGTPTQSTTENVSATLKMTSEIKLDEKNKEVKVKIGSGEIKGLGEGELISYQGIITYSQEYFGELTQDDIKAESGYTSKNIMLKGESQDLSALEPNDHDTSKWTNVKFTGVTADSNNIVKVTINFNLATSV